MYEDERTLAFHDIAPVAPFHVLVIPKKPIGGVLDMQQEDAPLIGHLIYVANKVARDLGFADEGTRARTYTLFSAISSRALQASALW